MDSCTREHEVAATARIGRLPDELATHAAGCAVCAEALLVASFLTGEEDHVDVPAPGLVYWRAELKARREQAERAMRPIRTMEIAAMVTLSTVAVCLGAASGSIALPLIGAGFLGTVAIAGWVVRTYLVKR